MQDKESGSMDFGCDTLKASNNHLARAVVADLSQKWRDFSAPTWIFGGGVRRLAEHLQPHFPRASWSAMPDYVTAQTFFVLAGGENPYGGALV